MASFNYNDPRYQREIQRAQAKGSATGNRARTEPISARHAAHQLGRQLQFQGLALESGMKKTQHEMNLARLKQSERMLGLRNARFNLLKRATNDRIDREKDNMDWTIGLGLGQLGYGALEGRRRRKIIESDLARKDKLMKMFDDYMVNDQQNKWNMEYGPEFY